MTLHAGTQRRRRGVWEARDGDERGARAGHASRIAHYFLRPVSVAASAKCAGASPHRQRDCPIAAQSQRRAAFHRRFASLPLLAATAHTSPPAAAPRVAELSSPCAARSSA